MIALYFACETDVDKDGCIYTVPLRKFYLVDSETDEKAPNTFPEMTSIKKPMYIVPKYTDVRYRNQKALFLLYNRPNKKIRVIKKAFIIKKECKKQILRDLAVLGYDKTLVYPLLDSLCADIKKSLDIT